MTEQVGSLKICCVANGTYTVTTTQPGEKITVNASDLLALMDWLLIYAERLEKIQARADKTNRLAKMVNEDALWLPEIPDS